MLAIHELYDNETRIKPDSWLAEWITHFQETNMTTLRRYSVSENMLKVGVEFAVFSSVALLTGPISPFNSLSCLLAGVS